MAAREHREPAVGQRRRHGRAVLEGHLVAVALQHQRGAATAASDRWSSSGSVVSIRSVLAYPNPPQPPPSAPLSAEHGTPNRARPGPCSGPDDLEIAGAVDSSGEMVDEQRMGAAAGCPGQLRTWKLVRIPLA
jgi:hypothetical protein